MEKAVYENQIYKNTKKEEKWKYSIDRKDVGGKHEAINMEGRAEKTHEQNLSSK